MKFYSKPRRLAMVLVLAALMLIPGPFHRAHAAGPWYVAPGGDDGFDCLSPATPCATIDGGIAKASPGDTILVAVGTYTNTGSVVVWIDRAVTLSGGWDASFSEQSGMSMIDGQGVRQNVYIDNGLAVTIERFIIENGFEFNVGGSGLLNYGLLTLNGSVVRDNYTRAGGAVFNYGIMTMNSSTVSGNTGQYNGGISNGDTMVLNNCTVSGNTSESASGIEAEQGTLYLNNTTVSGNTATSYGGGIVQNRGTVILRNSIVAGNTSPTDPDCSGTIQSAGYNLIGNTSGCTVTLGISDVLDVDPKLFPLMGVPGYHPLRGSSPAIDAGNPACCTDHLGTPLDTDQRGVARVGPCDIGSYEYDPANDPLTHIFLPLVPHDE